MSQISVQLHYLHRKRERVVETARLLASLYSSSRQDTTKEPLPPSKAERQFLRNLISLYTRGEDLPSDDDEEEKESPKSKVSSLQRPCPNDSRVFETLLAFFLLRSIELELQSVSADKSPPAKKRRVDKVPLFRLPCSFAELTRLFQTFCLRVYSSELDKSQEPCLPSVVDKAIPTVDDGGIIFPLEAQVSFYQKINTQTVSALLHQWERFRLVILHRPSGDLGVEANTLASVSRPAVTQLLTQSLADLGTAARRPVVPPSVSIYAQFQASQNTLKSPAAAAVPPPPPPPPSGSPLQAAQPDVARVATNTMLTTILKVLDTPSFSDSSKLATLANIPEAELSVKTLIEKSTVVDLLVRSSLIPSREDARFQTIRFCDLGSRENCAAARRGQCRRLHYKKLVQPHTDLTLGDCSYLDTCRHILTCKFVHYSLDLSPEEREAIIAHPHFRHRAVLLNQFDVLERSQESLKLLGQETSDEPLEELPETWFTQGVIQLFDKPSTPPQWIRCDMRSLDLSIFKGQISVVMADPPWDIRMDLPYGTMTDNEMKNLRVDLIQEEGLLFLWVTGRAMEIARDCMTAWGYRRVDELVWVKTNHLSRIIRTGRTGHWLNHSKEHCLIGVKGNPKINARLDCDVIVSEVRETSRKPDEIYRLIERLCPVGLKLELFGRQHNLRPNWITLGNQLDGVSLHTPQLIKSLKEKSKGLRQVKLEEAQRLALNQRAPKIA